MLCQQHAAVRTYVNLQTHPSQIFMTNSEGRKGGAFVDLIKIGLEKVTFYFRLHTQQYIRGSRGGSR